MLAVLKDRTYAHLFTAQVVALLGTGLLTVALGLLAFELGGENAALIMGVSMAIKMVAYVLVAPLMTAAVSTLPPTQVLVAADLVRAGVACALPFLGEVWQIYLLIFLLQCASATFTPTFQATIPTVLPQEPEYTKALSLSRLAYDLEALISPLLAVALLSVMSFHGLFAGTALGFVFSAGLVLRGRPPRTSSTSPEPWWTKATAGVRAFVASRELSGLMGANLAVAAVSSVVIVNSAPMVLGYLGRQQSEVAILLAGYGAGSMLVALSAPRLLEQVTDQALMAAGAMSMPVLLGLYGLTVPLLPETARWPVALIFWFALGATTSAVLTPSARLLRRASTEGTRPAIFAAQFSLSHACFLLTYPLAGTLGSAVGVPATCLILAALGLVGTAWCVATWKRPARIHAASCLCAQCA